MNLRCFYCQTPFTLGRAEILTALQRMDAENMNHYDAHCPRCRRANSVARQRLEMFLPNWREVAAEQVAMPAPAAQSAPMTATPPASAVSTSSEGPAPKASKSHRKRAGSAKAAAAKPAAKTTKKPAAAKAKPAAKPAVASKGKKTTTKDKKK